MTTVGAYEAKTKLSELLERVAKGERFVITKHGVPVAVLEPVSPKDKEPPRKVIEAIQQFQKGRRLGPLKIKDLIETGRRSSR